MKIRLTNLTIEGDADIADALLHPPSDSPPPTSELPPDPGPGPSQLPKGWDTDKSIGYYMLVTAMQAAGLTPIGVQGKGADIVAAMIASYPDWDVYLSKTDSPIVPGWGSLDVTVDSGKKGWSFRPDGYFPWKPKDQR